jgi:ATP-dependent helicase/nuclease subunit B
MEFLLSNGLRVSFSGIIDRVDLLKKDGEILVRVVDYKTGTKQFSLDDVSHGINMQMLLYLFTLCRNRDNDFTRSLGLSSDQNPSPAGIVYLSANIPVVEAEDYDDEEGILNTAADSLDRSGLLLSDEAVLHAMNDELSPKFLAGIKKNKDGELIGKALTDNEGFSKIYEDIRAVIERITTELCEGKADADPLTYNGKDPCSYCNMKPICRRAKS